MCVIQAYHIIATSVHTGHLHIVIYVGQSYLIPNDDLWGRPSNFRPSGVVYGYPWLWLTIRSLFRIAKLLFCVCGDNAEIKLRGIQSRKLANDPTLRCMPRGMCFLE